MSLSVLATPLGGRRRARSRPKAGLALGLCLAFSATLLAGGCGESVTEPPPPAVVSTFKGLMGRQITWDTDQPTRGAVRYGFVSGQYDRLAYPTAVGGADRAYLGTHAVPLLAAAAGATVYFQRTDRTADGRFFIAAEETVALGAVPATAPQLAFTTLDVQFGDAHVLRLPTAGDVVMIDAGSPYESRGGETAPQHVIHWLDDHAIGRLDWALATHVHADHIGGFVTDGAEADGLLERWPVGAYLDVPAVTEGKTLYSQLLSLLQAQGTPRLVIAPGMTSTSHPDALDWDPGVEVMVLNAGAQPEWADGDLNNDSVVLKVSYGAVDLITGGDCLVLGEQRILANYAGALADVEYFKASHHGRSNANSVSYLTAISPRAAVIPVAFAAYYEGPDQGALDTAQTIERLGNLRADIFRYDAADPLGRPQDNTTFWHTTFVTDGASYELRLEPSVWGL